MKTVLLAAIIIVACTLIAISCKWSATNTAHPPFSIVGKWKIDSFYTTPHRDSAQALLSALFKPKDGATNNLIFGTDSMITTSFRKDTTRYYLKDSTLFIKEEDSSFLPLHLSISNDSLISFKLIDSIVLVLKKQ